MRGLCGKMKLDSASQTDEKSINNRISALEHDFRSIRIVLESFHKFGGADKLAATRAAESGPKLSQDYAEGRCWYQSLGEHVDSLVGLQEAALSERRSIRIIWSFLVLAGIILTGVFIYFTASEYLEEPTATKIILNSSTDYEFPPLAVCPSAWVDTVSALEAGLTLDGVRYAMAYIDPFASSVDDFENATRAKEEFLEYYNSNNFSSLVEFFKNITITLPMAGDIKFKKHTTAVKLTPKPLFVKPLFLSYEVCYAFKFESTAPSWNRAATAKVKFEDRSMGIFADSTLGLWFQMIVDLNFLSNEVPPIFIPANVKAKIFVNAREYSVVNTKEAPCHESDDDVPDDAGGDEHNTYACSANCRNRFYEEMLRCKMFRYSYATDHLRPDQCCNAVDQPLGNTTSSHVDAAINKQSSKECAKRCLRRCNRFLYHASLQWLQPMQLHDKDDSTKNCSTSGSSSKTTFVDVYVEHTANYEGEIMHFKEVQTYSFTELVNNVGGTLGLFVGATLMTFAQVIFYFVNYFWCRKRGKGKTGIGGRRDAVSL